MLNSFAPKFFSALCVVASLTGCNYSDGDTLASNDTDTIVLETGEKEIPRPVSPFLPLFDMTQKELISELGGDTPSTTHIKKNEDGSIILIENLPYKEYSISVDFYRRKIDWKPKNLEIRYPVGDSPKSLTEATKHIKAICGERISEWGGFYAFDEGGCQYKRALGEEGTFEIKFFEEGQFKKEAVLTFHHILAKSVPRTS
ncbi:hypothetical protein ACFL4G_08635 [Thermodesulfobacteriota bacterium]